MAEKIQTSLVNTIPLWKSQMVLALGMEHSKQAMEAQREVSDVTNELLKKNAEALHQGSIEVAKESERGIVELETLKHTNKLLIDTMDEVLSIQKQGPNLTEIHADVYCERASHKSIIIGKQGSMLRTIGSEARVDIERLLGTKVNLKLWVKVREDWRNRAGDLRTLGYEE